MRYSLQTAPIEVLKAWKQSFVYHSHVTGKWHASLETSTNALLLSAPSIDLGAFASKHDALAAVNAAIETISHLD